MQVYTFAVGHIRSLVEIREIATKLGIPASVELISALHLPNPHYALKKHVSDAQLLDWFRATPKRALRLNNVVKLAQEALLISPITTIALYCHGGRHRSRAVALALKEADPRIAIISFR